jgi:hypothetical protein
MIMAFSMPMHGNIIEYRTKRDVNGNTRRVYVAYAGGRTLRFERAPHNVPAWVTEYTARCGIYPERIEVTPSQWRALAKQDTTDFDRSN